MFGNKLPVDTFAYKHEFRSCSSFFMDPAIKKLQLYPNFITLYLKNILLHFTKSRYNSSQLKGFFQY